MNTQYELIFAKHKAFIEEWVATDGGESILALFTLEFQNAALNSDTININEIMVKAINQVTSQKELFKMSFILCNITNAILSADKQVKKEFIESLLKDHPNELLEIAILCIATKEENKECEKVMHKVKDEQDGDLRYEDLMFVVSRNIEAISCLSALIIGRLYKLHLTQEKK